jgi:hypothetical protein
VARVHVLQMGLQSSLVDYQDPHRLGCFQRAAWLELEGRGAQWVRMGQPSPWTLRLSAPSGSWQTSDPVVRHHAKEALRLARTRIYWMRNAAPSEEPNSV